MIGNKEFIPFGSQYYRAPTPPRGEWQKDLANIKEHGFNVIKIWAQWRWNNPAEGEYNFSDLDEIMDIAHKNGLKVIINTIFDVAPIWVYKKYPDCLMETEDGRKVTPRVTAYRQIGGAPGPCFHHEGAVSALGDFLAVTVKHYRNHPALHIWDLWNEPELTCGILREPRLENLVCYCKQSENEFIKWLKNKYLTVDKLNMVWNRNYRSWQDVELPHSGATYMDMMDWRQFFIDTITAQMIYRKNIAKEHDKVHPVMCHIVPIPLFNMITCASDDWELASNGDLFGNSAGTDPFSSDIAISAARGKDVLCAEIHALSGTTLSRPKPLDFNEMNRMILSPLARGIKGFVFWQYRCELLGREGPAWGFTFPDGSETPWLSHAKKINHVLQKNVDFINGCTLEMPEVGILFNPKNQIFLWCASQRLDFHDNSLIGAHRAIFEQNYNAGIVHPNDILAASFSNYKVIYAPFVYYLENNIVDALSEWVYEGGTLIAEPFFAGIDTATGLHQQIVPGYSLSTLFGAYEGITYPLSEMINVYENDTSVNMKSQAIIKATLDSYEGVNEVDGAGALVQIGLNVNDATIIGEFENGTPAITKKSYGRGMAILIGSFLSLNYYRTGNKGTAELMTALIKEAGCCPSLKLKASGRVRADMLKGKDGNLLIIDNMEDDFDVVDVFLKNIKINSIVDLYNEVSVDMEESGTNTKISLSIGPNQIVPFKITTG